MTLPFIIPNRMMPTTSSTPSMNITKSLKIGLPPGIVASPSNGIIPSARSIYPCLVTLSVPSCASVTLIQSDPNMPPTLGNAPLLVPKSSMPQHLTIPLPLMPLIACSGSHWHLIILCECCRSHHAGCPWHPCHPTD